MPVVPLVHAAASHALSGDPPPYILGIVPTTTGHLALHHPETDITIADRVTLQAVDTLRGMHTAPVTAVCCDAGSVWSSGKDARIVRWDERSHRAVSEINAFIRKPLPVTALAVCGDDNLVVGGTELVSSEAHILFWDIRNTSAPAYQHSSTHSDDITQLAFLPPTSLFTANTAGKELPRRLLLSASTDGCIALSDALEKDDEEALQAEENWNSSIAAAGAYAHGGAMRVWARSDMDTVATWGVGIGSEGELEFGGFEEVASDQFKQRELKTGKGEVTTEYLIDVCPSLGVGVSGAPMVGAGSNDGSVVLEHSAGERAYNPSAFFLPGPSGAVHADVVRCMYHAQADQALYTGSEDGVLAAWNLADVKLLVGDPTVDGVGDSDGDEDGAESEDDERPAGAMDVDGEGQGSKDDDLLSRAERRKRRKERKAKGEPSDRKEKRKAKRHAPY